MMTRTADPGGFPLVSVIIPSYNSEALLPRTLQSVYEQTYSRIEVVVVDNFSTDETTSIVEQFGAKLFSSGGERSAQSNFGVAASSGDLVFRVDSDFLLSPEVISECVEIICRGFDAVVVHNSPDPSLGLLSRVRKFEIDMYKGDIRHSAARFFKREVFLGLGGYNTELIAGEDYDLQRRLNEAGFRTGFAEAEAVHLGEPSSLLDACRKFVFYGKDLTRFVDEHGANSARYLSPIRPEFIRHWRKFAVSPFLALGFFGYSILKWSCGGFGFFVARVFPDTVK